MAITLPPLPYDRTALEPHISAETLDYHHGKHHKAYVDKTNELIAGTPLENASLEEIVRNSEGTLYNNAAQAWNHNLYWQVMGPNAGGEPTGALADAIARGFGDFETFKTQFNDAGMKTFGSGWVWLSQRKDGSLAIQSTSNAANPLTGDDIALLGCDVWEHAYYIDRRNARADYLKHFWEIVNWDFVARQMR